MIAGSYGKAKFSLEETGGLSCKATVGFPPTMNESSYSVTLPAFGAISVFGF